MSEDITVILNEDVTVLLNADITVQLLPDDVIEVEVLGGSPIEINMTSIDLMEGAFPDPDVFTTDGINKTYPTTSKFRSKSTLIFLDGVYQGKGVDYAEDIGQQSITFVNMPPAGLKGEIRYVVD